MATTTVSESRPNAEDAGPERGAAFIAAPDPHLAVQRPRRGRPPVAEPRPKVTIRLPQKTLEALRQSGRGWQTRLARLAGEMVAAEQAAGASSTPDMMQAAMTSEGEANGAAERPAGKHHAR